MAKQADDIHKSGEDYLEAILMLQKKNGAARAVDVARLLNVSKPSVSRAMSVLEDTGYITVGETSFLQLTEKGKAKANDVYGRHILLTKFLMKITGVPELQAEENACRIEHDIDSDVKNGIERWMKKNA